MTIYVCLYSMLLKATLLLSLAALCAGCDTAATNHSNAVARSQHHAAIVKAETLLLRRVATAANEFSRAYGCAPGNPDDLMATPTEDRLADLDCTAEADEGVTAVIKSHLMPEIAADISRLKFVRRWDGLFVIEYTTKTGHNASPLNEQCTFLDAQNQLCPFTQRETIAQMVAQKDSVASRN